MAGVSSRLYPRLFAPFHIISLQNIQRRVAAIEAELEELRNKSISTALTEAALLSKTREEARELSESEIDHVRTSFPCPIIGMS
jgi:hypothetical protein